MQISIPLRNLSLGVTTASFLLAGSALAQPEHSSQPYPSQTQQWQMKAVNAQLDHTLDAQSARVGQRVAAKLYHTLKTANGAKLPGGTDVWGTVEKVQASENGGPSTVTLRFTTAALKNGQHVPVKVTVIGAFPYDARSSYANAMGGTLPSPPDHIQPQDKYMQEPGLLKHIEMKSAVQGHDSATFTDQNGNVKLRQGTWLQLAIAARNSNRQSQSGL